MILFFSFLVATVLTMVAIPLTVRLAGWLHAADLPNDRKIHKTPMSRLGGVAMATGALLPVFMWAPRQPRLAGFLAGVAVLLFFGIWDDIKGIDYRLKFLGQLIAVAVVISYGDVVISHLPFFGLDPVPMYLAVPLTIFALVGITNAVNLADGLDGLASGIVLLSVGTIAILAYMAGDQSVILISVSVMGSILGFLRFNTYPASTFMGDTGSQFLGFSVGVLVVMLTQQADTTLSTALPLLILGLPILDTVTVIAERLYERRSPFLPDKKHLHHKLLGLGFDHYEAVFVIYLLQSLLIVTAYFLRFESDWLIILVYATFCAALVAALRLAIARNWRMHHHKPGANSPVVPAWIRWLRQDQRILKAGFYCAVVAINSYFLLGVVFVQSVPKDIGALAFLLLIPLLMLYFRYRSKPFHIVERASLYIAVICLVYLVQVTPGIAPDLALYRNILFGAMMLAVVIGFRFSKERFRPTPTDFLVIFMALVVPNLPDSNINAHATGMSIAMLIVLFYSIELVLNNIWHGWDAMRFATYLTLGVLGFRAWFTA